MKNKIKFMGVLLCAIVFANCAQCAEKLLIAGCNFKKIMLIDKSTGAKEWIYEIPQYSECNCASLSKDKKLLVYANKRNVRLINFKTQEQIWEMPIPQGQEAHTARFLPNGNILVGICALPQARILEIDKNAKILKEINFDTGISNPHGQFRQIIKNKKGNYVVPLMGKGAVVEVGSKGEILNEAQPRAPFFSVKELKNGNWLLSGEGGRIYIINPATKETVRIIDNKNIDGAKMLFMTEAQMLKNGNILASNWNGHSPDKSQPKLMEIDKNNRVVWKLENDEDIPNISAVTIVGK
ncbi:MAG: hypothetical protein IKO42_01555 [Opitutales bacterium]|nr:hypothetical protein [Opitutales bacterium]